MDSKKNIEDLPSVSEVSSSETSDSTNTSIGVPSPDTSSSPTVSQGNNVKTKDCTDIGDQDKKMSVDDIIKCLGKGPSSYLALVAAGLSIMAQTVHLVGSEFTAPPASFVCADPLNEDVYAINGTECFVTANTTEGIWTSSEEQPCKNFIYDTSMFETTVTMEFDLVCSRQFSQTLYQLIYTIGSVFGVLMGGLLCERFGRQRAIWLCTLTLVVTTLTQVFVPVLWVVLSARFVMGVMNMIGATSSFVLMMEVSPPHLRTVFGIVVALPYAIMMSLLGVIGYFFRNWKTITLLGSVPVFILAILTNPLILGESPRWLIIRGRLADAEQAIRRAAKLNKTSDKLPSNLAKLLGKIRENELSNTDASAETLTQGLWSLVSSSPMRKLLFLMSAELFALGALYIYIPLATESVKSPFVYLLILGIVEFPAYSLTVPVAARFGRRWVTSICNIISGVMQALLAVSLALDYDEDWIHIFTAAITYTLICSSFQITQMFTSELYPTSVRTLGTAIILAMANLGFCLPPLMDYMIPEDFPWLAPMIYSLLCLGAAVYVLYLPETNGAPLLETVAQYKETYGKKKKNSDPEKTRN